MYTTAIEITVNPRSFTQSLQGPVSYFISLLEREREGERERPQYVKAIQMMHGQSTQFVQKPCDLLPREDLKRKQPLNKALSMMNLVETLEEPESSYRTPSAKKPRLATDVVRQLDLTPPPVVGSQTVPHHVKETLCLK